jgi:hypothetical protein
VKVDGFVPLIQVFDMPRALAFYRDAQRRGLSGARAASAIPRTMPVTRHAAQARVHASIASTRKVEGSLAPCAMQNDS